MFMLSTVTLPFVVVRPFRNDTIVCARFDLDTSLRISQASQVLVTPWTAQRKRPSERLILAATSISQLLASLPSIIITML
jgi:hypothetical protein